MEPWADWIDSLQGKQKSLLLVTDELLEMYLKGKKGIKTKGSYERIGTQLAAFSNRFLTNKIDLRVPLHFKTIKERV